MAEPKTKPTDQNPVDFINTLEPEQKKQDALTLLQIFEEATGEKGVMWGTAIIGFGSYLVNSPGRADAWPLSAFSPRKQNLTLYVISDHQDNPALLAKLGKHTTSKACLYIKALADVDLSVLQHIIKNSYQHEKQNRERL